MGFLSQLRLFLLIILNKKTYELFNVHDEKDNPLKRKFANEIFAILVASHTLYFRDGLFVVNCLITHSYCKEHRAEGMHSKTSFSLKVDFVVSHLPFHLKTQVQLHTCMRAWRVSPPQQTSGNSNLLGWKRLKVKHYHI